MLEPLFDAELDYQPGMAPLTSEGDGALIGSGDGAVHGPKLSGKLEWTLFEQPDSTVCPMAPVTRITTGDDAQIRFEGRGYATRASHSDPVWRVAATLYFTTGDSRYSWLNGALALWEGEFNEVTNRARTRPSSNPPPRRSDWSRATGRPVSLPRQAGRHPGIGQPRPARARTIGRDVQAGHLFAPIRLPLSRHRRKQPRPLPACSV